ncbi:MAG: ABC transporter ATP-binding protein, partial [Anaerovoracaceae bacterium]|nr:ABC transporter ATP-binding protein [Anaerovoracaceae bacterium]
ERPLLINGYSKEEAKERILDTVEKVNLRKELLDRFPNELSGGQQQRVSIARAISLMPRILVLDEPTSALDVSVQAQTLNELLRLQKELNMTYIFITHNLSVVRYMSDRICVMYGGKVMEIGKTEDIYEHCMHPYTLGLMSSVPPLHPRERNRKKHLLSGDMPSLIDVGEGCRFCSRCKYSKEICQNTQPPLKEVGEGHIVACHFAGELDF